MKVCSGRWRVALGMGAALAITLGTAPAGRASEKGRPLFPWRKQAAPTSLSQSPPTTIQMPTSKDGAVVLPEALTLEDDSPLTSIAQTDPPRPPASSTGQLGSVPSPPPPLNRAAPSALDSQPLTPVPNATTGEVLGGPVGDVMHGDPYPVFYRDRPAGHKNKQAEIIARNRGSEHAWYKEWRTQYYGYYPTQWRPWPDGWHLGRNIPPSPPYVHPYDLKQPEPQTPEEQRPPTPRSLRDRDREQEQKRDADRPRDPTAAPPLRTPSDTKSGETKGGDAKSDQQKKGP